MGTSAPASPLAFDHLEPAQWSSASQFYKAHYLEGARLKPGDEVYILRAPADASAASPGAVVAAVRSWFEHDAAGRAGALESLVPLIRWSLLPVAAQPAAFGFEHAPTHVPPQQPLLVHWLSPARVPGPGEEGEEG